MIKNILVAIGDATHEKNAFDYAGHLAVLLDAHLSCVFFNDSNHRVPEDIVSRVLDWTQAECEQYDFLNYRIDTVTGKRADMVCQQARSADLVVLGIPESVKNDSQRLRHDSQLDDVLLNITKPVVVVHEGCTALQKLLIVNRGDSHSDRVLELSAEIGEKVEAELLGMALAETQQRATEIQSQMANYLGFYEVQTEFTTALGFTVANILDVASEQDCDLIALSASHHSRLYERLFQSTTETVIKLANRAVLVAR